MVKSKKESMMRLKKAVGFVLFVLVLATPSLSAEITVNAALGQTIQTAINGASSGDTIIIYPGTYHENLNLLGLDRITLRGTNPSDPATVLETIIDGSASGPVIYLPSTDNAPTITINGLTIQNGSGQNGGGICNAMRYQPIIENCVIRNNTAGNGGGIYGATLVTNCDIYNNTAIGAYPSTGMGGGIYGVAEIRDSLVYDNTADTYGGGIYSIMLTALRCEITGNVSKSGGGIEIRIGGLDISDSLISGNTALPNGGGITVLDAYMTMRNCRIVGNTATNGGGMLLTSIAPHQAVSINNSLFAGNVANSGGALWMDGAPITLVNCTIADNYSDHPYGAYVGAGLYVYSNSTTDPSSLTNCVVDDNICLYDGSENNFAGQPINTYNTLISGEPMLDSTNEYRPLPGSPCIDAGTNVGAPADDLSGSIVRPADGDCDSVSITDIGAWEYAVPDSDGDGYDDCSDCAPNNPDINPGAMEIKHDAIDQDCNGYDLTIDILAAEYRGNRAELTVLATSSLGSSAALELVGYGPMTYVLNKNHWSISVVVPSSPSFVAVCGTEGCEEGPVTNR
jgi:hypothetical protein